jgi:hypothetical protein
MVAATLGEPVRAVAQEALQEITVTARRDVQSVFDYGTTIPNVGFGYSGVGSPSAMSQGRIPTGSSTRIKSRNKRK